MSYPSSSSSSLNYSSPFNSSRSSGGISSYASSADTLPISSNSGDSDPIEKMKSLRSTNAWGILYSMNNKLYKNVHLEGDNIYTAGRDKSCNYTFEKNGFIGENKLDLYANISKRHFEIFKVTDDTDIGYSVYFKNVSSINPNFVNDCKVKHGQIVGLPNDSIIALNFKSNEAFQFNNVQVMLNELNSLPIEFRKSYDLQRIKLGSGATGKIF